MRKNYQKPTTKVVNVNVKAIMEPEVSTTSTPIDPDETATEAPLF